MAAFNFRVTRQMYRYSACNPFLAQFSTNKIKFLSHSNAFVNKTASVLIAGIVFFLISLLSPLQALAAKPLEIVDDFGGGKTLGVSSGVTFNNADIGTVAEFKRNSESRLVYPYAKGFPRQGTAEFIVKVDNAYHYADGTLKDKQDCALIFTTDIQGGDVTWPGSAWLYACKNGDISFHIAGEKFENGWADKYKLVAKGTDFRFGAWHVIGISFGNAGKSIMLNGKIVASNPKQTETLAGGGDRNRSMGQPTIGESVTNFWRNNQHEGGFEGGVSRVFVSSAQNKWTLTKNKEVLDKLKISQASANAVPASPTKGANAQASPVLEKNIPFTFWFDSQPPTESDTEFFNGAAKSIGILSNNNRELERSANAHNISIIEVPQANEQYQSLLLKHRISTDFFYELERAQLVLSIRMLTNNCRVSRSCSDGEATNQAEQLLLFANSRASQARAVSAQKAVDDRNRKILTAVVGSYALSMLNTLQEAGRISEADRREYEASHPTCQGSADACYSITAVSPGGRRVSITCTHGSRAGEKLEVCGNDKGRWASGCGITDAFAHHYDSVKSAARQACDL